MDTKSGLVGWVALAGFLAALSSPAREAKERSIRGATHPIMEVEGNQVLPVGRELGDVIQSHVFKIFKEGYAQSLSPDDFFHGHFYVEDCANKPAEAESIHEWSTGYLQQRPYFLYHTFEAMYMDTPYKGPPRSILGKIDGNISVLKSNTLSYYSDGTVDGTDPLEFDGKLHPGFCEASLENVRIPFQKLSYEAKFQFLILPFKKGRYITPSGQTYDVFYWVSKVPSFSAKK